VEQATADDLERGRAAFAQHRWDEAYEVLSSADREQRLEADDLARLAEAARWSANYDAMFNAYERAEAAYARDGNSRRAARMAFELLVEHFFRRNESATMGWFARASSLLGDDTECEEYGLLQWCESRMLFDAGQVSEAQPLLEEILALAGRIGAIEIEALARQGLGHVAVMEGRVPDGLRLIDESNALAMSGVPPWTAGMIYCSTIWACRNIGDWRRASEWTDSSIRWCERESVTHFPGLCRFHRAEVLRVRGALDDAERDALAAFEELMQANPRDAPWAMGELGEIRRRRGDLEGAAEAFRSAIELGFDPQPGLALLRLDERKPAAALRAITDTLANEDWFTREGRGFLLPAQVTIAIAAGELDVARKALDELERRPGRELVVPGSRDLCRGRARAGGGRSGGRRRGTAPWHPQLARGRRPLRGCGRPGRPGAGVPGAR
jgi:tetratricopeptide (TPR) repeat protein